MKHKLAVRFRRRANADHPPDRLPDVRQKPNPLQLQTCQIEPVEIRPIQMEPPRVEPVQIQVEPLRVEPVPHQMPNVVENSTS